MGRPMQIVVAAVIEKDGRFLVARRASGSQQGRWEFPGGKRSDGETLAQAAEREIFEEFGVVIRAGATILEVPFRIDGRAYLLVAVEAHHVRGEYRPRDHDRVRWARHTELAALDLADPDVPVARQIVERRTRRDRRRTDER